MNKIKKIATLCVALVLSLGIGAFAACNDDESSSPAESSVEGSKTYTAYEFVVKNADGSAATGVSVYLCVIKEDGKLGGCNQPFPVDDNGRVVYTLITTPGLYEIHVQDTVTTAILDIEGGNPRTDATAFGEYTLILKN